MIIFESGYSSAIPVNHARIGYENYPATATGTAGQTYNPDVVTNPNTYERWNPSGTGVLTIDLGASLPVSYIGLAAHNLDGRAVTVSRSTNNSTYTSIYGGTISGLEPVMLAFNTFTARYIRISISGGDLGVVYCGQLLEMLRGSYAGHSPINLSRNTVKNLNRSVKGQFLGTSIVRSGISTGYDFNNLPIDWYEQNIEPFSLSARTKPIFIAWNPLEHPDHVAYGYVQQDIKPKLSGTLNYCSFDFSLDAYVSE